MLRAQYSRISNFRPQSLARFKIYDIFYNSRCAKIADFGGKLTCTDFKVPFGRGGAFLLGHESGRCSVHVNVQLLGKGGDSLCPPIIVCSHLRGSKGPLCLFGLLSHHFS